MIYISPMLGVKSIATKQLRFYVTKIVIHMFFIEKTNFFFRKNGAITIVKSTIVGSYWNKIIDRRILILIM